MENISALLDYFKKIQKAIDTADFTFFQYKFVKKNRMDDLLVCTLALLPESFKKAMKKKLQIDVFPSVSCYNRLSKIIKKTFILSSDFYVINYGEAVTLLKGIKQNLERDIKKLEEE